MNSQFMELCADHGKDFDRVKKEAKNQTKETLNASFLVACEYNNTDIIKYLIEDHKIDIHTTDEHGRNGIMLAVEYEHIIVVKYLMKLGVSPVQRDNYGESAMDWDKKIIIKALKENLK